MERKIGEVFEYNGVKLRVEREIDGCHRCYFYSIGFCPKEFNEICGLNPWKLKSGSGLIFIEIKDMNEENKQSILYEAKAIVEGNRRSDYGDPVESFERIAKTASMITGKDLSPKECCAVLMAVKIVREGYRHKRDNLVDLCGYAHIMNELNENEQKRKEKKDGQTRQQRDV